MATAGAGRAAKGSSQASRAFRAPSQRARLAVGGRGRGEDKPKPSSCAQRRGVDMTGYDPEIEELRDKVHAPWCWSEPRRHGNWIARRARELSLKYRRATDHSILATVSMRMISKPQPQA